MPERPTSVTDIAHAFAAYDQRATFKNLKVACILGMLLMPAGTVLDWFVYHEQGHVPLFFLLRLICSFLIGLFLGIVITPFGQRHHKLLGVTLAMFPTTFMCIMIYLTEGATSPYYAGLNLVLLMIGFVCNWAFWESFSAVLMVLGLYLAACFLHGPVTAERTLSIFSNNLYFLILTGIIVVTGNHFHTRLRFSEFALRFELDKNRRELEENHQRLLELDQIKTRFFANVSHELRTPLTLLLAPIESLIERFGASFDAETRELLLTMRANGMRLLKLINDLLDLVRLESGRIEVRREPLAMPELLHGLASAVRQVVQDKRLTLETTVAPDVGIVLADRDKMEKILLNLVFNAIKFTPSGGSIRIDARRVEKILVMEVADTGMGISEKNLPHIFDRFWQADDSSRRKYQGMGLGLSLVKELVEVQDGTVSVQSREGEGTTFTLQLPYLEATPEQVPSTKPFVHGKRKGEAKSDTEWLTNLYRRAELFPAITPMVQATRTPQDVADPSRPTVLVADDEPDMLRYLKARLSVHFNVIEAVNGEVAVEKTARYLPDIVLLDMMMPGKDGLQACRELRNGDPTRSIPVILLTARADEETKLAALAAGASDFLAKPFSTAELHIRIRNLVESYRYQQKLSRQNQLLEDTIEQLKETETQLVQSEKLASLGRMSAGIIHEINNPLNFAATGLYTLRNKARYLAPDQQGEYSEILKDVEEGLQRVKSIVTDLRSFSHQQNEGREQVELVEVVAAALRFLSHEWRDRVDVRQKVPDHLAVWANKNKLIQVLVNLFQNALDALGSKTFIDGEKPAIQLSARTEAGRVLLMLRDNGTGIAPEHLDKIFDPFFTTKDVGKGMGLGLSIVYRMVQEFEARIGVRSEPGRFTEFTLDFPAKGAAR